MPPEDLLKTHPHLKEFLPYLDLLHKESDRGKVLISTGYLEQQLKDVLLAFMLANPQATDLVSGHNAPLGTLSARITACYALGLISEDEHADLQLIRKIRNEFAHHVHTSFETPSVVDRCRELRHKVPDTMTPGEEPRRLNAQAQFTTAVVPIIMNLVNRPHYVAQQRRTSVEWPR